MTLFLWTVIVWHGFVLVGDVFNLWINHNRQASMVSFLLHLSFVSAAANLLWSM